MKNKTLPLLAFFIITSSLLLLNNCSTKYKDDINNKIVYPFSIPPLPLKNFTDVYWIGSVKAPSISGPIATYKDCWRFSKNTDNSIHYEWRSEIYKPKHNSFVYFPTNHSKSVVQNYFIIRHDITNNYLNQESTWKNAGVVLAGYKKRYKTFSNTSMSHILYFKNFSKLGKKRNIQFNFGSAYYFQLNSIFPKYPGYKPYDLKNAQSTLIEENKEHAVESSHSSIFQDLWASYEATEGLSDFPTDKCPKP